MSESVNIDTFFMVEFAYDAILRYKKHYNQEDEEYSAQLGTFLKHIKYNSFGNDNKDTLAKLEDFSFEVRSFKSKFPKEHRLSEIRKIEQIYYDLLSMYASILLYTKSPWESKKNTLLKQFFKLYLDYIS
jgi:hypothetical protein